MLKCIAETIPRVTGEDKTELATILSRDRNLQAVSECSGITSHCQRYMQHTGDEMLRFRKSNCNVITATDIVQIRQRNVKAFEEVRHFVSLCVT